jgi:hypothetical protein
VTSDLALPAAKEALKRAVLFEISGFWVRNVGNRHDMKPQLQRLIRRIVQRVKIQR